MPTGELTLDIKNFDKNISEAVRDMEDLADSMKLTRNEVNKLEKELAKLKASPRGSSMRAKASASGRTESVIAGEIKLAKVGLKEQTSLYKDLQKEVQTYGSAATAANTKQTGLIGGLTKLRTVIGLISSSVAIGGIFSSIKALTSWGKEIKDVSTVAEVLPEPLQRLQAALSRHVSIDDSTKAILELHAAMKEAKEGSVEATDKLNRLGISFDDIATKSPDQIMLQLAENISTTESKSEALRNVTNLFGTDLGARLIPALSEGAKKLKEYGDAANVARGQTVDLAADGAHAIDSFFNNAKRGALEGAGKFYRFVQNLRVGNIRDAFMGPKKGMEFPVSRSTIDDVTKGSGKPFSLPSPATQSGTGSLPADTKPVDQAKAERESLRSQSELALKILPEYVKQKELLLIQGTRLKEQLKSARGIEIERVQLQIDQNKEAQRALDFADKLRDSTIELNKAKATQGRGFDESRRMALAEILDLNNQIAIAEKQSDAEKMAALKAQRRQSVIAMIESKEAHDDELAQLRFATREIEAQSKGLVGVASQVAIIAKYDAEITKQLRLQNAEAVKLLEKQKKLSLRDSLAAEHDETPAQRRAARRENRVKNRKANQQLAKENELRKRAAAGQMSPEIRAQLEKDAASREAGARAREAGIPIEDRIAAEETKGQGIANMNLPDKQKQAAMKESKARLAQLTKQRDDANIGKNVADIARVIVKGD